jgi:hypothetical protein
MQNAAPEANFEAPILSLHQVNFSFNERDS